MNVITNEAETESVPTARSEGAPVVLVFGAQGGVGSALARRLTARGTQLVLSGRRETELAELASSLGAMSFPADATDFEAVDAVFSDALEGYGRIDGVVNCVGSLLLKPAHLTRPSEWNETIATNLTSAFAILRAAVGPMSKQGSGSVVLVSTAAARIGLANHEAIAAAKGGIDALVRSAAATYGRSGVRINAVAPGLVATPLTSRITGNERARESSEAMHALRRVGDPDEVAAAIEWLLVDGSWVTGQTLGVDGGLGTVRSA
jgi:NAD(P)-dependent dehydrogenase (short-subunit alcohol dehydrogenase family)